VPDGLLSPKTACTPLICKRSSTDFFLFFSLRRVFYVVCPGPLFVKVESSSRRSGVCGPLCCTVRCCDAVPLFVLVGRRGEMGVSSVVVEPARSF